MPSLPLLVTGKVYDNNGTELIGALVTAVNITTNSNEIRNITTATGYVLDIANCDYSSGDSIRLVASYEGWGEKTYNFTAGSGFAHNFTLDESEGGTGWEYQPRFRMMKAELASFDGEDIKHSNPLPVSILNALVPKSFDYIVPTYDADKNLTKAIFKTGGASGTVVATITITYDSDGDFTSVLKT